MSCFQRESKHLLRTHTNIVIFNNQSQYYFIKTITLIKATKVRLFRDVASFPPTNYMKFNELEMPPWMFHILSMNVVTQNMSHKTFTARWGTVFSYILTHLQERTRSCVVPDNYKKVEAIYFCYYDLRRWGKNSEYLGGIARHFHGMEQEGSR